MNYDQKAALVRQGILGYRLARRCPRCHAHRMHWSHRTPSDVTPVVITITCAECGHDWRGKYRKSEWGDEED